MDGGNRLPGSTLWCDFIFKFCGTTVWNLKNKLEFGATTSKLSIIVNQVQLNVLWQGYFIKNVHGNQKTNFKFKSKDGHFYGTLTCKRCDWLR